MGPRLSPSGLGGVTPGREKRRKQDRVVFISDTQFPCLANKEDVGDVWLILCGECPTVAGTGKGRRGLHLWSRKADGGRRRSLKWGKRRHRSTDLWSGCWLPGGERRGRTKSYGLNLALRSEDPGELVPLTLYINTVPCRWLTDFNWSRQRGGETQGARVRNRSRTHFIYTVWMTSMAAGQTLWLMKSCGAIDRKPKA